MREILAILQEKHEVIRITPACAGNTILTDQLQPTLQWITPACAGNTICFIFVAISGSGSPPHVREIPLSRVAFHLYFRITPACAGNTNGKRIVTTRRGGSPPHVREIPQASNQNNQSI